MIQMLPGGQAVVVRPEANAIVVRPPITVDEDLK